MIIFVWCHIVRGVFESDWHRSEEQAYRHNPGAGWHLCGLTDAQVEEIFS